MLHCNEWIQGCQICTYLCTNDRVSVWECKKICQLWMNQFFKQSSMNIYLFSLVFLVLLTFLYWGHIKNMLYMSNLLLREFTECTCAIIFGKFFHKVVILLRRTYVLGSFYSIFSVCSKSILASKTNIAICSKSNIASKKNILTPLKRAGTQNGYCNILNLRELWFWKTP